MPATANRPRLYVVRNSPIHGRGVFAACTIPKGTRIIEYRGRRIEWEEALALPDSDPDNPYHTFFFSLDDGRVIDAGQRGNAARWINHGCDPNCKTQEDEDGRVFIYAKRTIVAGEELAYDYKLTLDYKPSKRDRKAYTCRCGASDCRGSLLDPKLLKRFNKKKKKS